ncbi:hypothetical protein ACHWQZ_G010012 [Mnemiopsis leidyi]
MNRLELSILLLLNVFVSTVLSMGWFIDLKYGGHKAANKIARKYNLVNRGNKGSLKHIFLLETKSDDFRSRRRRDTSLYYRSKEEMMHDIKNSLFHERGVLFAEENRELSRKPRGIFNPDNCCDFNDPEYSRQWVYRNDYRLDMNIEGAWRQGITGKGVIVSILDDGVERIHDDLKDNWDAAASYDFNDDDLDPSPRMTEDSENMHGTRCAGQVAASANNGKCGVGAAFEANIGGIRMLDGRISDDVECDSIGFKRNYIDIYSMSWGPDDDGKTIDGPGSCTKTALKEGARKGRHGKGSIFVWASGNGGKANDDCNLDGYVSSIYTIAISAISSSGLSPWYSESCACTLASAYSSGFGNEEKILTTDVHNSCTDDHTGTSAAAPLAVGVLALVLQANPELTWRDMQHLIVRTASRVSNDRDSQWIENGAGHEFHPKLGFGVLDATKMVNVARNWTSVPPQRKCMALKSNRTNSPTTVPRVVPPLRILNMRTTIYPEDCIDKATNRSGKDHLSKLEHVQLYITMHTPTRGDIVLKLTSPSGTTSKLLSMRPEDSPDMSRGHSANPRSGFKNWAFMTVNFWDENPYGQWQLQIINGHQNKKNIPLPPTKLKKFKLIFWGSGGASSSHEGGADVDEDEPDEIVDQDDDNENSRDKVDMTEEPMETMLSESPSVSSL